MTTAWSRWWTTMSSVISMCHWWRTVVIRSVTTSGRHRLLKSEKRNHSKQSCFFDMNRFSSQDIYKNNSKKRSRFISFLIKSQKRLEKGHSEAFTDSFTNHVYIKITANINSLWKQRTFVDLSYFSIMDLISWSSQSPWSAQCSIEMLST